MPLPLKVTVLVPGVNVPPVWDQLPETSNVPEGAVKVPKDKVMLVVATVPVDPVKVPPLTVKPPLKVCVAVEALYVPPETVVSPVAVVVCALALYVPLAIVNVPLTVTAPVGLKVPPTPLKLRLLYVLPKLSPV